MARRDLTLGESFHRTKRTLLLFCTAIVVTRIPGIDVTSHSGLLGLSLVNVDIDLIRWLLWFAASYYLSGFLLEAITERQSNAGSLRMGGVNGLADDIENFRSKIAHEQGVLEGKIKSAGAAVEGFQDNLERIRSDLNELSVKAHPNSSGGRTFIGENMAREYLERADRLPSEVLGTITASWHDHAAQSQASYARAIELFEDLKSDLHRLARDIMGTRRLLFYGWEIGGALLMFTIATIAMPRPFGL